MGIPAETRTVLEREEREGKGGRVIRGNGIFAKAKGEVEDLEADRLRREAAVERVKLFAERLAMVVKYDELGEAVLDGKIRWRRENDRCCFLGSGFSI